MNGIQIFNNPQFGQIRTVEIDNEPHFVASDIAKVLGYAKPQNAIAAHVDEDDSLKWGITDTLGREQETILINESGLYSLIMSSKLPQAKQFKKWVTAEVLPTIRKHGAYMSEQVIERTLQDPDYLIQLATAMKQEREARLIAEQEAKMAQLALKQAAPAIAYQKVVEQSVNSILIRDLAKLMCKDGVKIGQNKLFGWLREHKYINDYNEPYQRYMDMGLFERIPYQVDHGGEMRTHFTTKVTGKGQVYFVNKFMQECRQDHL